MAETHSEFDFRTFFRSKSQKLQGMRDFLLPPGVMILLKTNTPDEQNLKEDSRQVAKDRPENQCRVLSVALCLPAFLTVLQHPMDALTVYPEGGFDNTAQGCSRSERTLGRRTPCDRPTPKGVAQGRLIVQPLRG